MMLYSYHNSYYYRGLNSIIGLDEADFADATYDVAEAVLKHTDDVTLAFCTSNFGTVVLMRAGIPAEKVNEFLAGARPKITAAMVVLPENEIFSLIGLGKYLLAHDAEFARMIEHTGVTHETLLGSLRWVVGNHHEFKRAERWWSKDNLSRTTGLGREWAYGRAYLLEKFARRIQTSAVFSTLTSDLPFAEAKITEIESALVRAKAANVLIVGEAGVGKVDLVMAVSDRMRHGLSLDAISGKHIVVLDTGRIFATVRDKQNLEVTLMQLFGEAEAAGNTIILIENLSNFVREAEALGVFLPELLDPFLASPEIQIIATDTPSNFHTHLETLGGFTRRFAEVLIDSPDQTATIRVLQGSAASLENKHKVLFTYSALVAVATAADRYIVDGVMPDKAIGLLVDIATKAQRAKVNFITPEYVYEEASQLTGIPVGPIKEEERDLLLHLEDRLHERVIGQEAALSAISRTLRRARAGIQTADKPIGSFLFLGPTGVGKTETAKALAFVFFGGEDKMQRLDMSEFSGADGLAQLIGEGEEPGALTTLLREHPYCVLLLDEFEKANQSVHDLFLQILDEGVFTDARGMKINARNTLIIATSNAGSQLILKTVEQRQSLAALNQEIIDHIVHEGIYRPELINRFDNTIIFEPLSIGEQTEVASLMLKDLYERVKERGYTVSVSRDLLDYLVEQGYNPEYGARPMRRLLQDVVEEKIAQKIIAGELNKGDSLTLTRADVVEHEIEA